MGTQIRRSETTTLCVLIIKGKRVIKEEKT